MACRICRAPLDTYQATSGGAALTFVHPARPGGFDHDPQPVPVIELDTVRTSCDFCGDRYPLLVFDTSRIRATTVTGDIHDYGASWAACAACAADLDAHRPDQLARRALGQLGLPFNGPAGEAVRALHAAVAAARHPRPALATDTRWPHLPLRPRLLPAIRDRLTALMLADYRLPPSLETPGTRPATAESLRRATLLWADPTATLHTRAALTRRPRVNPASLPVTDGLLLWGTPIGRSRHGTLDVISWTSRDDDIGVTVYRAFGGTLRGSARRAVQDELGWLLPVQHVDLRSGHQPATTDPDAPLAALGQLLAGGALTLTPLPPLAPSRAADKSATPPGVVQRVRLAPKDGAGSGAGSNPFSEEGPR